jgi:hypothetical protein
MHIQNTQYLSHSSLHQLGYVWFNTNKDKRTQEPTQQKDARTFSISWLLWSQHRLAMAALAEHESCCFHASSVVMSEKKIYEIGTEYPGEESLRYSKLHSFLSYV